MRKPIIKTKGSIWLPGISVAIAALHVSGCATTYKVRTGSVHGGALKPGYRCPDFTFLDQDGRADTFSHVRGAVTMVVFPDDPEWPNCARCKQMVALAAEVQRLDRPVVMVSVCSPGEGQGRSAAALHRCPMEERAQLVALCDHRGRVRDLLGPNAIGKFFVVGPNARIAASCTFAKDLHVLEAALRKAVQEHQSEVDSVNMPG